MTMFCWCLQIFRYKTIAPISFVDETLFEVPKKLSQDPSERSVVISRFELERIKKASYVWTLEDKEVELELQRREREMAKKAAEERIAKIRQADILRKKRQGLSRLEAEAREMAQYAVERANEFRMEDDPEMKSLNALILGAKCFAERDVQVQERRQMVAVEEEEDRRFDSAMEQDRLNAIRAQEETDAMRKEERLWGKIRIQEQIEERMEEGRLQEELKEQEKQKLLENMEQIKMDDLQAQFRKKEAQRRLQQEVLEKNEESQRAKDRKKEEDRETDILLVEKACKKMEDQRMRKNQEAWENEWRRKEREQARKKADDREWWKLARQEQTADKEQQMAVKIGREKTDYERVLRAQNEDLAREMGREERRRQRAMQYMLDMRQQLRERDTQAVDQRRAASEEHERILEEAISRRVRLNELKARKLMELKAAGIPERYCAKVENKVTI
ncbi:cilia- and flagella-associated protein 45-like isoform X3 [Anguilla anguilla]|uniref:cilia- and flagella-associated protein 45-like isoform X3 n=1 Tax=Anguilla anguilla TaxID=7936 RepID=UPI0015B191E8|nr:cilia- and flagella-associated protein 45-like isoform X3 [Anguilla anguilla]